MSTIDFSKPVWLYDDRSKDDRILRAVDLLWTDHRFALVRVESADEPLLVRLEDGRVSNEDYSSWYATDVCKP